MSASVDQRTKGQHSQVSNGPGPKEQMKEEFDAYLTQPQVGFAQGGYSSAPMSSPNVSEQAYMPTSYYPSMSFPYLNQGGLNEGAWSNGGDMGFLGGYGQMNNDYMSGNGMFSGFGYQPGFGWEFPSGDYTWGTSSSQARKSDDRAYDGYYGMGPADGYSAMNGDLDRDVKSVDQGFKGMNLADQRGDMGHHHVDKGHVHEAPAASSGPSQGSAPPPKKTWASIASQPAKPQTQLKPKSIPRAPVLPNKHNMDIGTWDNKNNAAKQTTPQARQAWGAPRGRSGAMQPYSTGPQSGTAPSNSSPPAPAPATVPAHPVLDKLRSANQYNPKEFNMSPKGARYFIIKSYSEDDIHRSIKYSIWTSTEHGNKRLDSAYREREGKGPVYLFYSVNGSGHFCGMAQMMSPVDYHASSNVWAQDKWKGQFEVKWIYVKDVPNSQLRHIRLENNENKPVTNSRDTQEVPPEKGKQVLKILHNYRHTTSIFDDFSHYEKRQEEDTVKPKERQPERSQNKESREGRGDGGRGEGREGGREGRRRPNHNN